MYETWRNQAQLKANAGLQARGRKNINPVLHYTLSWHETDRPTDRQMRDAAINTLVLLGLGEHEAVVAGHTDTKHCHVHIVCNTVHPYTGRTADLKFTKEKLSRWAQEYEQTLGIIHCEERVRNNEQRDLIRKERERERLFEKSALAPPAPYRPVKDQSPSRPIWIARQTLVETMKMMRANLDERHKAERSQAGFAREHEREALDKESTAALDRQARAVKDLFRPQWKTLYQAQNRERRFVANNRTNILERAVFVFRNRARLFSAYPPKFKEIAGLIVSRKKLDQALSRVHQKERRALGRSQNATLRRGSDLIMQAHRERYHAMAQRHLNETRALEQHHDHERGLITLSAAKTKIMTPAVERTRLVRNGPVPDQFNDAAWAANSLSFDELPRRADRIRHDMESWRRHQGHRDLGREL
jgi:hypothetical protein